MVVDGQHEQDSIGIINWDVNSTLDTAKSNRAGLPAYNHDSWSIQQALASLDSLYPFDPNEMAIVDTMTAVATMKLLGVRDIYPRLALAA
ncbi:MAG: hypothetical protein WDN66_03110 [Candidatus Saccharibacteria bacterium]